MSGNRKAITLVQIKSDELRAWRHHARDFDTIRKSLATKTGIEFNETDIQNLLDQSNRQLRETQVIATDKIIAYVKPTKLEYIGATATNILEAHNKLAAGERLILKATDFTISGVSMLDTEMEVNSAFWTFYNHKKSDKGFNDTLKQIETELDNYIASPGLMAKLTCNTPMSIHYASTLKGDIKEALSMSTQTARLNKIATSVQRELTAHQDRDKIRAEAGKRPHPYSNFKSLLTWLKQLTVAHAHACEIPLAAFSKAHSGPIAGAGEAVSLTHEAPLLAAAGAGVSAAAEIKPEFPG